MKIEANSALSLSALLCLLPISCLSQTSSLTGYVIDGLTGRPMSGVKLHLDGTIENSPPSEGRRGPAASPVAPDADGHFAFTGLSAGHYELQAELPHEIVTYGEITDPPYAIGFRSIEVGPAWEGRTIFFRIVPRAVLTVTVRDGFGDPIDGAEVQTYRFDRRGPRIDNISVEMISTNGRQGARIGLFTAGASSTDDRGQYRVEDLWPGDYVICASPPPYRYHVPTAESTVQYRPGAPSQVYVRTCYPDLGSRNARFRIEPGGRPHLDLTLASTPAYSVRVTGLAEPDSASLSSGRVWPLFTLNHDDATGSPDNLMEAVDLPNGGVEVRNVPPGNYVAEARVIDMEGPGSVVRRQITISDGPPAPLELTPMSGASIEVHVRNADGSEIDDGVATVSFVPASDGLWVRRLEKSQSLVLDPGAYWLSIRAKQPYCAVSARLAGQEVMQRRITIVPAMSARLDVDLGSHCGSIDIHTVAQGIAAPFSNFLLLLSGTPQDPGGVVTGTSDARGQSLVGPLSPGRYLLWAWLSDGHGYVGPDLADAAGTAVEVVVNAGGVASVSIAADQPEGASK
jgi:hypothetical protein